MHAKIPEMWRRALLVSAFAVATASTAAAAVLSDAAIRAYTEYAGAARQAFLNRLHDPVAATDTERATLRGGEAIVRPGEGDGILSRADSLVHHWRGAIFLRGVTLDQVLRVSRSYPDYPRIFKPIIAAAVLSDDGQVLHAKFRMRESAGGMTAVLDMASTIRYARADDLRAYVISITDDIHQVEDAGRATEHLLPAGRDSGYLWRASAFTRFVEGDGGVYMEMETIGLSRQFPPLLGWLIEPFARRVGRQSVENSMEEFRLAVLDRAPRRVDTQLSESGHR